MLMLLIIRNGLDSAILSDKRKMKYCARHHYPNRLASFGLSSELNKAKCPGSWKFVL